MAFGNEAAKLFWEAALPLASTVKPSLILRMENNLFLLLSKEIKVTQEGALLRLLLWVIKPDNLK